MMIFQDAGPYEMKTNNPSKMHKSYDEPYDSVGAADFSEFAGETQEEGTKRKSGGDCELKKQSQETGEIILTEQECSGMRFVHREYSRGLHRVLHAVEC